MSSWHISSFRRHILTYFKLYRRAARWRMFHRDSTRSTAGLGTINIHQHPSTPTTPPPPQPPPHPPPPVDPSDIPHRYRFAARPSTATPLHESLCADVRLAAGPSARRGRGPECLSQAALIGPASLERTDLRPPLSPEPRISLETSVSLPALQTPSPWDGGRPLKELTLTQLSREEFDELETACDTALERQRELRELERVAREVEARAACAARAALAASMSRQGSSEFDAAIGVSGAIEEAGVSTGLDGLASQSQKRAYDEETAQQAGGGGDGGGGGGGGGGSFSAEPTTKGGGSAVRCAAPDAPRELPELPYAPSMWSARRKTLLLQSKQQAARGGGAGGAGGGAPLQVSLVEVSKRDIRNTRILRALREAPLLEGLGEATLAMLVAAGQPHALPRYAALPRETPRPRPYVMSRGMRRVGTRSSTARGPTPRPSGSCSGVGCSSPPSAARQTPYSPAARATWACAWGPSASRARRA